MILGNPRNIHKMSSYEGVLKRLLSRRDNPDRNVLIDTIAQGLRSVEENYEGITKLTNLDNYFSYCTTLEKNKKSCIEKNRKFFFSL